MSRSAAWCPRTKDGHDLEALSAGARVWWPSAPSSPPRTEPNPDPWLGFYDAFVGDGRGTWVEQHAALLQEELSTLGLTISAEQAQDVVRERRDHVSKLMRVTPRSAQRYIDDEATRALARELAFTLADEQPGADLTSAPRTSHLSLPQIARLVTALAEVGQFWLSGGGEEATRPLDLFSCLSLVGIFLSDTVTADVRAGRPGQALVAVPPALLTRAARALEVCARQLRQDGYPGTEGVRAAGLADAFEADAATLRALANEPGSHH